MSKKRDWGRKERAAAKVDFFPLPPFSLPIADMEEHGQIDR